MPAITAEVDSYYSGDWSRWPLPVLPDVPAEPWAEFDPPWARRVDDLPVDTERTAALAEVDVSIGIQAPQRPYLGSSYGMPYCLYDTTRAEKVRMWILSKAVGSKPGPPGFLGIRWPVPVFPTIDVPLPHHVRLENDPAGASDNHFYGLDLDHDVLVELHYVKKSWFNRLATWNQTEWTIGYSGGGSGHAIWDLSKPFDRPGQPAGVVASSVPQFPMILRWDEIQRGEIGHCLFGVLPNYSSEVTGWARHSDGDADGHPVRSGEILRLTDEAYERFCTDHPEGTPERIIVVALRERGMFQGDRNSPIGKPVPVGVGGGCPISQDRRWRDGDGTIPGFRGLTFRLTDLEVVIQP